VEELELTSNVVRAQERHPVLVCGWQAEPVSTELAKPPNMSAKLLAGTGRSHHCIPSRQAVVRRGYLFLGRVP
jgi:hypothetical protein